MREKQTVVIVGGGLSGSLTAYHLFGNGAAVKVILVEPRADLGLGLAYATPTSKHLLNVPAAKLSALPDEPDHFLHWLRKNYDYTAAGVDFAPRRVYGQYIQSLLRTLPRIDHRQTTALDCRTNGKQALLRLADGSTVLADAVVLALGNFDPAPLPGVAEATIAGGTYCRSAWEDSTYANLSRCAPVVLIGSGLTAIDVVLRLRDTGHRGPITTISRHGMSPHRHIAYQPLAEPAISGDPPSTARGLLRAVRRAIRSGADWHAVIDSLRERTNELWLALPLVEQKRFQRHLQRRWEVVRHRMAPKIADQIEAELEAGTLKKLRGTVQAVLPLARGALVQFQAGDGNVQAIRADRIINCTGPDINYRRVGSPLLDSLFDQGLVVAGPHGAGLWTNAAGALRNRGGSFSEMLFNIGPGRQGTLLESIAVPELRRQAADLARLLTAQFGASVTGRRAAARGSFATRTYELAS